MIRQAAIAQFQGSLFLVSTMEYSTTSSKSSLIELQIRKYLEIEKDLLKALISKSSATAALPSKVTVHGPDFYFHLLIQGRRERRRQTRVLSLLQTISLLQAISPLDNYFIATYQYVGKLIYVALCDASYSHSIAYTFLQQLATEFLQMPQSASQATRPYSLMKLEPWIQDLKRQFNGMTRRKSSVRDEEIKVIDIVDLIPHRASQLVPIKPKLALSANWSIRFLITHSLVLFLADLFLSFNLILNWFQVLQSPQHKVI